MGIDRKVKEPSTYLDGFFDSKGYYKDITVEHRSNNPKRDFLFVNKKQCKHIPCSPSDMLEMCRSLTEDIINNIDEDLEILVIGFAETATAIGHAVADMLPQCKYVMTTTREDIPGSRELITFEEEHSHATTQKLLFWEDIDDTVIEDIDYILFVEDEISTGKTILNFIEAFEKKFKKKFNFGVASICNWQNSINAEDFYGREIDTFALVRGELKSDTVKMDLLSDDIIDEKLLVRESYNRSKYDYFIIMGKDSQFEVNRLGRYKDCNKNDLFGKFDADYEQYIKHIDAGKSVRIIGTEECMYQAIKIGETLENKGHKVICHASTRSKIDVLNCDSYDITNEICGREKLHSAYSVDRETYIYNTDYKTDYLIVVTDTQNDEALHKFMQDIVDIFGYKVDKIQLVRL